jgi:hypothetical protein
MAEMVEDKAFNWSDEEMGQTGSPNQEPSKIKKPKYNK